ncbi:MAG: alpha-1,2-fucosyltransferase [Sphingobacteriaceae bacterium]|nr:alpha-1,2-fucosyltransferase [Sphingobacteriaceae bacterium]
MKIVKFLGGLGNQMFQYAFYLALKQKFKKVKADLSGFEDYSLHNGFELERVFGIKIPLASEYDIRIYRNENQDFITRKIRQLKGVKRAYQSENIFFGFESEIFKDPKPRYYWGYWQNYNYLIGIEDQLKNEFKFIEPLDNENLILMEEIESSDSISIHVRRGDYLKDPLLSGVSDLAYYERAIESIRKKVSNPRFIVFSNDITWCKASLGLESAVYVDWNTGRDSFRDMQLMSCCKHNIVSNSSFSWWASWLNNFERKIVVSPKSWMNDSSYDYSGIIMKNWVQI